MIKDIDAMPAPETYRRKRKNFLEPLAENEVLVARPTRWGSPFKLAPEDIGNYEAHADSVRQFDEYVRKEKPELVELAKLKLKGQILVCYCSLDVPCHADVWYRIANED